MRVADPEGDHMLDPSDPRLLLKADKTKGERGVWKLLPEGTDNDKDERWNEDGPGGVNFNRNFPFHYEFFGDVSGPHQVSEIETRALADFLVAHPNVGIAFTFGAADNLIQTPKSEPGGKRPPNLISDADVPYVRELGKAFREALGLKKELNGSSEPGTLSDWIYFHRGRLSLAARPWNLTAQIEIDKARQAEADKAKAERQRKSEKAKPDDEKAATKSSEADKASSKDESQKAPAEAKKDEKKDQAAGEEERAVLKWFEENAPSGFVPWKEFKHPDFPDQKVEIGGWAPFARSVPPERVLAKLVNAHKQFLTDLASQLPRVGVREAEVKHLGNSVYELQLLIENSGYLPCRQLWPKAPLLAKCSPRASR
jgi:hypothetical protein